MFGYECWEVGVGYVNVCLVVVVVLFEDMDYKVMVNNLDGKSFKVNVFVIISDWVENFDVFYLLVGEFEVIFFEVGIEEVFVKVFVDSFVNLIKFVFVVFDGIEYCGNLIMLVFFIIMCVVVLVMFGMWGVYVYGLILFFGVEVDLLGLINGLGLFEIFNVIVLFENSGGFEGMDDVEGYF